MSSRGLARAGAVSLVGAVTGAGVNFGLGIIVGRGLGTDGTGTFFQVVAIFIILANVLELGADTGLVRFCSSAVATESYGELRPLVRVAVVPVVVIGVVLAVLAWIMAPQLAGLITAEPGVATVDIVRTLVPFILVASLLAVVLGATRGLGSPATFTVLQNIALPVGRFGLIGAALLAGSGLIDVLRAWIVPLPFVLVIAIAVLTRQLARRTRGHEDAAAAVPMGALRRRFWGFSSARAVAAAVEILLEWVDVLIVAAFRSPAEAGIYAVVTRSVRAGLVVQQAARLAVAPMVSAALARGDTAECSRLYVVVAKTMVLVSWPFYLLLACFGPGVLAIFGPGFAAGSDALAIMSLTMAVATAAGMVQTVLLMGGKSSWQLADKSAALAVNVGLNLALVPVWGIVGAAVAWAVTVVVDTALAAWQVHRGMGIHVSPVSLVVPAALPLLVFGGGGLLIRALLGSGVTGLVTTLVGGAVVYVALGWLLRRQLGFSAILPAGQTGRRPPGGGRHARAPAGRVPVP